MIGMDERTGAPLGGLDHIRQSIRRIIATPVPTRVMRRTFAGHVGDLVDRPAHDATVLRLFAAVADALDRWEPRMRLRACALAARAADGRAVVSLTVDLTADGRRAALDIPLSGYSAMPGAAMPGLSR